MPLITLANCDTEPVHAPDAIQPFGYLLALDSKQRAITHWSSNLAELWELPSEPSADSLRQLFDIESLNAVLSKSNVELRHATLAPARLRLASGKAIRASSYLQGGQIVLELESIEEQCPQALIRQQEAVAAFASGLEALVDPLRVCEVACEAIRELTGYDRVMAYRFHEDLHGEVIAEQRRDDLEPWLGLHYPASDIPAPARAIFAINKLRVIPNVDYEPVPLVGDGATRAGQLDLSRSLLRSVSPIHLEYLRNMGVRASLTLSVKQGEKLWGLIACHHYVEPYTPGSALRNACAIVADYLSGAITLKAQQGIFRGRREVAEVERALRVQMEQADNLIASLVSEQRNVLELMPDGCAGAAVVHSGRIGTLGLTPRRDQIQEIVQWLRTVKKAKVYATDSLSAELAAAKSYATSASGLLAIVVADPADTTVLWFKPETLQSVRWAGDPDKAARVSGMRIHPRKSFEAWQQTVRLKSLPWEPWEAEAASAFLRAVETEELRRSFKRERNARNEAERANRLKEEFIGIISHDLRDPLSSMNLSLVVLRKLLTPTVSGSADTMLRSMERAITQMRGLVTSLLEVSALEAGKLELHRARFSAAGLVRDCAEVLRPLAWEKHIDLRVAVPERDVTVVADREHLLQVYSNLVGNAIKFTDEGGCIQLRLEEIDDSLIFKVEDTGQGIGAEDLPHIFDRFRRARGAQSAGFGLGLAIAKGIVEAHGGTIHVLSTLGEGSTFWFQIPKGLA
jgi:light-regulated signal transduction histidine kinase (bacteriophytochrome)